MNMYSYIAMFSLLVSCRHVSEFAVQDTSKTSFCMEIAGNDSCSYHWGSEPSAFGNEISFASGIHYSCPSVNPNNTNQFVCFKQDYSFPPKVSIITYDMSTEAENVLFTFSGVMIGNLSWGKKDWIAFTQGQGTIRIFKSDGSNDHQIVESSGMNFLIGTGPEWSPDGDFLYYHTLNTIPPTGIICDTNGITISNPKIINRPDWNSNNIIVGADGWLLSTLDLSTDEKIIIGQWSPLNEGDAVNFIEWLPDNRHAVFSKDKGMYRVDSQTGEILQMKECCITKKYRALSVSNEDSFILCEKVVGKQTGPHTAVERSEIWKMDLNGCNEVRILPRE